jgi:phosphoserine phosphatase
MAIKMLFADMEGTLFEKQQVRLRHLEPSYHHSLWSRLMYELGEDALKEDARTIVKWESGQYRSYLDWVDDSVVILQKHGMNQELFERTLSSIQYNDGVKDTLERLHDRGIRTAIVTGGFLEQARRAQQELRITHAYAAVDLFWSPHGSIAHWNMFPSDYEGKVDYVRSIMREYGLSREECGFVGDGKNDAFIAREVGTSFAYQAHPELQAVSSHEIEEFSQILEWIP